MPIEPLQTPPAAWVDVEISLNHRGRTVNIRPTSLAAVSARSSMSWPASLALTEMCNEQSRLRTM